MSHEHSMQINQDEVPPEFRRHVPPKKRNGIMSFFVKLLVIIAFTLIALTCAAFAIANFSPTTYAQAKDIIFEKVAIAKLTGRPDSVNKEYLDSWLVFNSDKQQVEDTGVDEKAQGEIVREDNSERQLN